MSTFLIMVAPILVVFISLAIFFIWGLFTKGNFEDEI